MLTFKSVNLKAAAAIHGPILAKISGSSELLAFVNAATNFNDTQLTQITFPAADILSRVRKEDKLDPADSLIFSWLGWWAVFYSDRDSIPEHHLNSLKCLNKANRGYGDFAIADLYDAMVAQKGISREIAIERCYDVAARIGVHLIPHIW